KPPDVFYVAAEDFADWVRQGVLEPLDPFAKKTHFSSKPFYKGLANSFKYKGKTYGYPKDWSSLGMEVNPALLGGQPIPKTWAQLRSVAQKINIAGGKPICLSDDWARLMAFVYQAGGNGKTRGNLAFTVSYAMAKDSKQKAAAWTLLSYLTGRVGMKKWTSLGFALPARSDVKPVAGRGAFVKYPQFTHGWGNQVDFRHV